MKLRSDVSPEKKPVVWWPMIFAIFAGFVFVGPYGRHAALSEWALVALGFLAFLALYAVTLVKWYERRVVLWTITGVSLLGFVYAPFNEGAALYLIFATSFVPFAVEGDIRLSVAIIATILAIAGVESWVLRLPWYFWTYAGAYSVILGAAHIFAARQIKTDESLTKMMERERIARDLHDVLGHTLSLIVLKSELAGRLLDQNPERAKAEIADVENISRGALAEVRQTITGYQAETLPQAFARARAMLKAAGVMVDFRPASVDMSPAHEGILALVLREAITNVVRHSRAKMCRLELRQLNGGCKLEILDDGCGGPYVEGSGLRGMRARVEALGGTLELVPDSGTRLTITLPRHPGGSEE